MASSRIASREIRIPLLEKRIQDLIEMNAADYFPIDRQIYISYRIIDVKKREKKREKKKVT